MPRRKYRKKNPLFCCGKGGFSINGILGRDGIICQVNGSGISTGSVGWTLPS